MKCWPLRIFCAGLFLSGLSFSCGAYAGVALTESECARARDNEIRAIQENHALKVKLIESQYPAWTKTRRGK